MSSTRRNPMGSDKNLHSSKYQKSRHQGSTQNTDPVEGYAWGTID